MAQGRLPEKIGAPLGPSPLSPTAATKPKALWPWALSGGAVLAGALAVGGFLGFRAGWFSGEGYSRKVLVEQKLEPNPKSRVSVDVPGNQGKVVLPAGAVSKKSTLAVSAITGLDAPPEAGVGNTLDVRLGDLAQFDEPVTIEIPYDPAKVLGRRAKRRRCSR